jgi:hypothetical protein
MHEFQFIWWWDEKIGYVIDKCIVCSGIALMAKFATAWTPFDLKDTAQFSTSTLWNLRDLRRPMRQR